MSRGDQRWAHFRFSVIGPLLAAPPESGQLKVEIARLAAKQWKHPTREDSIRLGASTIERWYYKALRQRKDPVGALARKVRADEGTHRSVSNGLRSRLVAQYQEHPSWSYQLHSDNLGALLAADPSLGPMPSYASLRRFMKARGMLKRRRLGRGDTAGARAAEERFASLEIRSYESEYVNALWHLDFHGGSLKVLLNDGQWAVPALLGVLDDHSRLCAHGQWYLAETAENLVHGMCQGYEKRRLPRALMTDNGSAMIAAETVEGLRRLGIVHETTLCYSPYQNGKQEVFWAQVEGRLLAMLENCRELSLAQLNEATLAWIELEYNRKVHSETGQTPLARFIAGKDVGRPCWPADQLRMAFTAQVSRIQRRSDGTVSVEGVRFELPSRYGHLSKVAVRYASWDLSQVYLADPRSGQVLCRLYPQDKHKNADARRRSREPLATHQQAPTVCPSSGEMAPLLRKLIADYAATGLPPAYLPKDDLAAQPQEADR